MCTWLNKCSDRDEEPTSTGISKDGIEPRYTIYAYSPTKSEVLLSKSGEI